jgi:hypothetical protein
LLKRLRNAQAWLAGLISQAGRNTL